MKKRFLSILLSLCMVLALFPATAFAEDNEEPTETPVCTCEAVCAAEAMNADCPVCGAEGATAENCGKYEAPVEETEPEQTAVEKVQALIDALPDADTITEENRADVEAQLTAIDEAKFPLGDELDALDFTKYNDAIAALNELDGMGGAEIPETLENTLQGSGTETDPWILTQEVFNNANSSPVSLMHGCYYLDAGNYKLGEDITLSNGIVIYGDKNVVLNLDGRTLSSSNITLDYNSGYGSTLVLNDSSTAQTGTISGGEIEVNSYCTFNLKGGTISGAEYGVSISGGTFNMTGGSITECSTSIRNYGGTVTLPSGTTLDGKVETYGTFSFDGNTFEKDVQCGNKNWPVDGGTFLGVVKNGEYFGDQHKAGLITGGVFYEKVINYANGNHKSEYASEIRGGVFYNKVENQRYNQYDRDVKAKITGGVFLGGITGDGTVDETQHNITVDFGNGTTRSGIVVGDTLYPLGEPPVTREGFIFNGWYKDAAFTEPWDFTNQNPVEDNMAFYAKWVCAVHSGGTATCKAKAECSVCGEEYGEVNAANHTALNHVESKAATTEAEGNIEYWRCGDCGKHFSDNGGETEIALADTVIAKLTPEPTATPAPTAKPTAKPAHSPKTGDEAHVMLWLGLGLSAALALGYVSVKKKEN